MDAGPSFTNRILLISKVDTDDSLDKHTLLLQKLAGLVVC